MELTVKQPEAYRGNSTEARFIIGTIIITLTIAAISSYTDAGWFSAFSLAVGMYVVISGFALWQKDQFLYRLLLFGLVAGAVELLADCWLVQSTGTLIYPENEPMIACSPLYMPFAWAVVLIQVGYLGWLISGHKPLWVSMLATMGLGLLFIPLFEHWAYGAGWWYYIDTPMVFNTPYFIILGEGLICMMLPLLFKLQAHKKYTMAIFLGAAQGFWIWLAYFVSYSIIG